MNSITPTRTRHESGFTLIETLVAISILTIAIVGPYSIANNAINVSRVSQNELTASYLAQEGLEFVHATRDDNLLARVGGAGNWWLYGLDVCIWSEWSWWSECTVDSTSSQIAQCPWDGEAYACPPLFLSETGLYNQQESGTETVFVRSVRISESWWTSAQALVSVTVSWHERNGSVRSYTLEETLYDWLGYAN